MIPLYRYLITTDFLLPFIYVSVVFLGWRIFLIINSQKAFRRFEGKIGDGQQNLFYNFSSSWKCEARVLQFEKIWSRFAKHQHKHPCVVFHLFLRIRQIDGEKFCPHSRLKSRFLIKKSYGSLMSFLSDKNRFVIKKIWKSPRFLIKSS